MHAVDGCSEHPATKRRHGGRFEERSLTANLQRQTEHEQADAIVRSVGEEVERIGPAARPSR